MIASRATRPLLALAAVLAACGAAHAGWKEVTISIPVEPKLDVQPQDRVLVTLVRANDHPRFAPGLEISLWLRRALERSTPLRVIDVPPPPVPEQRPERLATNDAFWKQLGEDFEADLIVAGVARFDREDRSGFVTRDLVSPVTGQTVRRTVYEERFGYRLKLQVFFIKGDNGALLHEDTWSAEQVLRAEEPQEDLAMLHLLLESMRRELLAVLVPTRREEPRLIWVD